MNQREGRKKEGRTGRNDLMRRTVGTCGKKSPEVLPLGSSRSLPGSGLPRTLDFPGPPDLWESL